MNKFLTIIFGLILGFAAMQAQAPDAISWRISVKMKSATEGVVNLRAVIADGWHLYGTEMPEGGPKATSFSFAGSEGVKLIGTPKAVEKPIVKLDPMFEAKVPFWEGRVLFTQPFKVTDPAKAVIKGSVSFMGCNDETCLPPKTQTFTVKVPKK